MRDLDLDEIEARAKAATPGPWEADGCELVLPDEVRTIIGEMYGQPLGEDASYIAALSPDVALALVSRIRELEAEVARMRDAEAVAKARPEPVSREQTEEAVRREDADAIAAEVCQRLNAHQAMVVVVGPDREDNIIVGVTPSTGDGSAHDNCADTLYGVLLDELAIGVVDPERSS